MDSSIVMRAICILSAPNAHYYSWLKATSTYSSSIEFVFKEFPIAFFHYGMLLVCRVLQGFAHDKAHTANRRRQSHIYCVSLFGHVAHGKAHTTNRRRQSHVYCVSFFGHTAKSLPCIKNTRQIIFQKIRKQILKTAKKNLSIRGTPTNQPPARSVEVEQASRIRTCFSTTAPNTHSCLYSIFFATYILNKFK